MSSIVEKNARNAVERQVTEWNEQGRRKPSLNNKLSNLFHEQGWTAYECSENTGLSESLIKKVFSGQQGVFTFRSIVAICLALGLTFEDSKQIVCEAGFSLYNPEAEIRPTKEQLIFTILLQNPLDDPSPIKRIIFANEILKEHQLSCLNNRNRGD